MTMSALFRPHTSSTVAAVHKHKNRFEAAGGHNIMRRVSKGTLALRRPAPDASQNATWSIGLASAWSASSQDRCMGSAYVRRRKETSRYHTADGWACSAVIRSRIWSITDSTCVLCHDKLLYPLRHVSLVQGPSIHAAPIQPYPHPTPAVLHTPQAVSCEQPGYVPCEDTVPGCFAAL